MEPCKKVSHRPDEPCPQLGDSQWPRTVPGLRTLLLRVPKHSRSDKWEGLVLDTGRHRLLTTNVALYLGKFHVPVSGRGRLFQSPGASAGEPSPLRNPSSGRLPCSPLHPVRLSVCLPVPSHCSASPHLLLTSALCRFPLEADV